MAKTYTLYMEDRGEVCGYVMDTLELSGRDPLDYDMDMIVDSIIVGESYRGLAVEVTPEEFWIVVSEWRME